MPRKRFPQKRLQTEAVIHQVFGGRVLRILGPAYQGYADLHDVHESAVHPARRLTGADASALATCSPCMPEECDHSTVTPENAHLFGAFEGDQLMSVATYLECTGAAELGILTRPIARGKRFGASALSLAVHAAFEAGRLPVYQTLHANEGAIGLARSLNLHHYATHVAIRFR